MMKSMKACKYARISAVMAGTAMMIIMIMAGPAWGEERLCIESKIANIRSGPGTDNEVLWQVERYHPVNIVEKKGKWYRFTDFEGDFGWVHVALVGKTRSVITIKDECNVRTGPGTDNPVTFLVEKGVPFKVLARKGNWLKIEHSDGDTGWIYKTLVW
ncbi:MAG: SH3 domain-containing protein [Thermodesulfobacteriota bacterium]|nr:SH3 domain-containing protein [Thermodesulfobacteriota bacterium]